LRAVGVIAALVAVAAIAATYVFRDDADTTPDPAAPPARTTSTASTAGSGDLSETTVPTPAQMDAVARMLGDARRLAADGKTDEAKAAVDQAAKLIPGSFDIAQARVDIEQMGTPQYRLAAQTTRAQMAIAQDDWPAAEAALQAAAGIDPNAPQIAELRQRMQTTRQQGEKRQRHIGELLDEMRQAIARHDLVAADRALNEAERLDIRDPAIDPARVELARAQQDAARSRQQ
jgi:hypothetical protein